MRPLAFRRVADAGVHGMRLIRTRRPAICILLAGVFLLAGCRAPPPPGDGDVHPDSVLRAYFQRPEDPRRFALTVYESRYGPVFAGSKRLHMGQFEQVPFASARTASDPLIRVRGRTKRDVVALVDTASRDSWATLDAAGVFAARPLGPHAYRRDAAHLAAAEVGYAAYASKMIIEHLHIEDMVFYLRVPEVTLGPLARGNERPMPEMVLGCDLLRQFAFVRFDYPARMLFFSVDRAYEGDADALITAEPYTIVRGTPAVEALLDGVQTNVIIDTAGDYELAWNRPDGTLIRQFSMGDLVRRHVEVSDAERLGHGHPEIPRVGHRLLRRFAVVMDNQNRRILIERPSGYRPAREEPQAQDFFLPAQPQPRADYDEYIGL